MWGFGDIRGPASVVPAHEQVPAGPGREPETLGAFSVWVAGAIHSALLQRAPRTWASPRPRPPGGPFPAVFLILKLRPSPHSSLSKPYEASPPTPKFLGGASQN